MEDDQLRAAKRYEAWSSLAKLLGTLTVCCWVWAIWLAFYPVAAHYGNTHCGPPAFYEAPENQNYVGGCDHNVDGRIRGAVGVSVLALPLSAAWIWSGMVVRTRRDELLSLG